MTGEFGSLKIVVTTTVSGSLIFTEPVVKELLADGHRVIQVASDDQRCDDLSGAFKRIPMTRSINPIEDFRALGKWLVFLLRAQPDVIVSGTPKASMLSLIAAKLTGVKTRTYILHGAAWDKVGGLKVEVLKAADKVTMRCATAVFAVSDSLAQLSVSKGVAVRRPQVLGCGSVAGVDLDEFNCISKPTGQEPRRILFIGRLAQDKNIDSLLDVFELVKRAVDLSVELHVFGRIDEASPVSAETQERLFADPCIVCHGYTSDVPTVLRHADVLVLPSKREGLPQTVLEAQACGVPVIAWSCTGVVDAVSPKNRAMLTKVGDIKGMADQIATVLEDESLSQEIAEDGRRWVEENFDMTMVAERTKEFVVSQHSGVG